MLKKDGSGNGSNKNSNDTSTTGFQIYRSVDFTQCTDNAEMHFAKKLIDFTERRLANIITLTKDQKIKNNLLMLLEDYRLGKVMIAWRSGTPCYLNVRSAIILPPTLPSTTSTNNHKK